MSKLQMFLVERGVASRRKAGDLIKDGRVTVNGQVVMEPWFEVSGSDVRVELDGRPLQAVEEKKRTILLHKPRGYICSTSDRDGKTVFELLSGVRERLVPVGRLDRGSEGVLLLSNDGELIHRLTAPQLGCRKIYEVTVTGPVTDEQLVTLRSRMILDDYQIQPVDVERVKGRILPPDREMLTFVLLEGRNRQIRQMCEIVGLSVQRLIRVAIQDLGLGALKFGEYRDLRPEEVAALKAGKPIPVTPKRVSPPLRPRPNTHPFGERRRVGPPVQGRDLRRDRPVS
jgi:23S rRNA pseudouridine2605 synthase